jgi:hypothetical protein
MKTITYNLIENDNLYFEKISRLADEVIDSSRLGVERYIHLYTKYIDKNRIEEERSYEEYLFDMLSFCVYWKTYSKIAEETFVWPVYLARKLYNIRQKRKGLKKYIDPVRGVLFTAFLYENAVYPPAEFSEINIAKFINWLDATGEFREEVKRFRVLADYLNGLEISAKRVWVNEIGRVIERFDAQRENLLSAYTQNVKKFISEELDRHRWKEDYIFCGRKEVEYHLSMLGAELMNRAYSSMFNSSNSVTLLVPACMRKFGDDRCRADRNAFDIKCADCSSDCGVSMLNKKGKEEGFNVSIIPHSSDFTTWLKTWAVGGNIGVIGVACPLNLILGGLELKSLNIPAKCIPLNYCGCVNHWDKKGIPTEINMAELNKFLKERKTGIEKKTSQESYSVLCGF